MSIYATTLFFEDGWEDDDFPRTPFVYQGSHILPSAEDPRGGYIELACVPDHISRSGRDDGVEGDLKDWLRVTLFGEGECKDTVVLDRSQVEALRDYLTGWIDAEERA